MDSTTVFIVYTNSIAGGYGIGTYVKQLAAGIIKYTSVTPVVVQLISNAGIVEEKSENGYLELNIPTPDDIHSYHFNKYARNYYYSVVEGILQRYSNVNNIFLLNSYIPELAKIIKQRNLYNCRIIKTVHFLPAAFAATSTYQSSDDYLASNPINSRDTVFGTFKKADCIITLTNHTKKIILDHYRLNGKKIFVIPNGIESVKAISPSEKQVVKEKWGWNLKDKLLLLAGRIDSGKGGVQLIRAFNRIADKYTDARLIIAGDGTYATYMDEVSMPGKVTFTGKLSHKRLYELYSFVDIGVVPSLHEETSFVAIEMMYKSPRNLNSDLS